MANLNEIVRFLDEYLDIQNVKDTSWNGLQNEGKEDVKRVLLAVDACMDTFRKAAQDGADLIIVHHGHFWKSANPSFIGWNKERMNFLNKQGISLYAAHLPLDKHKESGNNAQLLKLLGAKISLEFHFYEGQNIGWIGTLDLPKTIEEAASILQKALKAECIMLPFGKKQISTIAACSGGGGYSAFFDFMDSGADLYITGDAIDVYFTAKDAKRNVIFAGHHATEIVGVKALADILRSRFEVDAEFVDLPTGL